MVYFMHMELKLKCVDTQMSIGQVAHMTGDLLVAMSLALVVQQ